MPGKYDSPRDEALHQLCTSEWANRSTGDVAAPTGYVWLITITEAELAEVSQALDSPEPEGLATADLVGTFLITEDTQGFVTVDRMERKDAWTSAEDRGLVNFYAVERAYAAWLD